MQAMFQNMIIYIALILLQDYGMEKSAGHVSD